MMVLLLVSVTKKWGIRSGHAESWCHSCEHLHCKSHICHLQAVSKLTTDNRPSLDTNVILFLTVFVHFLPTARKLLSKCSLFLLFHIFDSVFPVKYQPISMYLVNVPDSLFLTKSCLNLLPITWRTCTVLETNLRLYLQLDQIQAFRQVQRMEMSASFTEWKTALVLWWSHWCLNSHLSYSCDRPTYKSSLHSNTNPSPSQLWNWLINTWKIENQG